ncbi:hypothetical protein N431DRAFT_190545 [Stipitochalara longipes BDJ]|nr:hypothetical protein N431DRAFT_190545 [Stipitochalara longipes BDJ]
MATCSGKIQAQKKVVKIRTPRDHSLESMYCVLILMIGTEAKFQRVSPNSSSRISWATGTCALILYLLHRKITEHGNAARCSDNSEERVECISRALSLVRKWLVKSASRSDLRLYLYMCRTAASEPSPQTLGPGEIREVTSFPVSCGVLAKALIIGKGNDEQRYFSSVVNVARITTPPQAITEYPFGSTSGARLTDDWHQTPLPYL